MEILLQIDGMTCDGCRRAVERALSNVSGVGSVNIDLARGRARIEAAKADPASLLAAIEDAGYEAVVVG